jgi:hypothetical protein
MAKQGLPYFARAALEEQNGEREYAEETCQCPLCGNDTSLPIPLVLAGKFPSGFPRRRVNKISFRAEHITKLVAQIDSLILLWRGSP